MTENKEPLLFTEEGGFNQSAWTEWYTALHKATPTSAHRAFCERIAILPEPELETTSGKPNPLWQKWYRIRKRVSSNIALNTCKRRIKEKAEGKVLPEAHKTVWW